MDRICYCRPHGISKKNKKSPTRLPNYLGGWHPSLLPLETIKHPDVDIIVRGIGEITFLELVKCLGKKKRPLRKVLGITYKQKDRIITNRDRSNTSLNNLPPSAYNLVDVEKYMGPSRFVKTQRFEKLGGRIIGYVSSRGCPYNCAFCADSKVYNRKRIELSAKRVLKDLKHLIKTYNITGVVFEDTNFFANKKRLLNICKGIVDNNWDIKWSGYEKITRFLTFTKKELELIKKSGCTIIQAGVESGSQNVLDFLNKEMKVADIIKFSKLCNKYGIAIRFGIMVGIPGEKSKDLKLTLNLIKNIYKINEDNKVLVFFFTPYPGTRLYDLIVEKYGFEVPKSLIE